MTKKEEIMQMATQELPQLKALIGLNTSTDTDTATLALQEIEYLQMIGLSKPEIFECEPITVIMAIKRILKNNLSLDPGAGLVYTKTRSIKIGKTPQGKDIWGKALDVSESAEGLISIARQCGRILDIDRPKVIKDEKGKVTSVIARFLTPTFDGMRRPTAKWREIEFDESDFRRWQTASHKENARYKDDGNTVDYSNPNYKSLNGGIDSEFARAKAIRHGLKKLGTNQNESRALKIVVPSEKKVIVDTDADIAAMSDEYISHEDIPATTEGVAVFDEIKLPNL